MLTLLNLTHTHTQPCSCNLTGTELCNQTTGECVCKVRVDGASCDQCDESSFNFTLSGCESCDCDFIGSTNQSCDDRGVCTCMVIISSCY